MPRTRSLKWSELKIGIMAVAALLIAATLIVALGGEGGFFWQRYNLKVKFADAAGVQQGSPVRVAGVTVGAVTDIDVSWLRGRHASRDTRRHAGAHQDELPCNHRIGVAASVRGRSTSRASTVGQPIPEWGYVPSDAPAAAACGRDRAGEQGHRGDYGADAGHSRG